MRNICIYECFYCLKKKEESKRKIYWQNMKENIFFLKIWFTLFPKRMSNPTLGKNKNIL